MTAQNDTKNSPAENAPEPRTERPEDKRPAPDAPASSEATPSPQPDEQQAPELSEQMEAEIDRAMRNLGTDADQPTGKSGGKPGEPSAADQAGQPAHEATPSAGEGGRGGRSIRGPRVVRAGREHRTGTVVSVGPTDIFVEFGPKELGVVERSQFPEEELPTAGQQLEVAVERYEPTESIFICVRPGAVQKAAWESMEPGQTIEARVAAVNKGGLELELPDGHRAFMPASQVSLDHIKDLSIFVGEKLTCRVQRIDRRGKGNVVLSRREILQEEREKLAKELRESLQEGQTVEGTVRKIMPFGAFVDIGGVDGLVHVSDISHERIGQGEKAIARHVQEGQRVRVQILKLDWTSNRIALGMKQLQADPFAQVSTDLAEGADVTGRVVRITDFGAFVEVAPGVEGLLHISELDYRRVNSVDEVVKQDEIITVRVLKIDPDSRRVSLSLKATKPAPERPAGGGKGRGKGDRDTRSAEEIQKETPAMRRLREKFGNQGFKGGLG